MPEDTKPTKEKTPESKIKALETKVAKLEKMLCNHTHERDLKVSFFGNESSTEEKGEESDS